VVALNVPGLTESVSSANKEEELTPIQSSKVVWNVVEEPAGRTTGREKRRSRPFRESTREEPMVAVNDASPRTELMKSEGRMAPAVADFAPAAVVEDSSPEPLVVIEQTSTGTGTMIATEVESFGNVLVGG